MKALILVSLLVGYAAAYQICESPRDVVLVVEDSSFMTAGTQVGQLQSFLASIVNYFHLGAAAPYQQVAYQQYGGTVANLNVFYLNNYTETNDAKSAVLRQPFTLNAYTDNGPSISSALNFTWTDELSVTRGERSCYPTVVILVSYSDYFDPNKGANKGGLADTEKQIMEAQDLTSSRRLQNSDALVITIGIGPHRNPAHLQKIATNSTYYHDFADWSDLDDDAAVAVAAQACAYTVSGIFYPCEMQTVSADVVFAVDVSNGGFYSPDVAGDILNFTRRFLEPYVWGSDIAGNGHDGGVQAALVTYGRDADISVNFGDSKDLDDFQQRAETALSTPCPTCTGSCVVRALEQVNSHLFHTSNEDYRPTCTLHFLFVFTTNCFGCTGSSNDPIPIATQIRAGPGSGANGAEIFVVPLQPDPSFGFWKSPLEIADDFSHLYEAQGDPASILRNYLHKQAWRRVCVSRGGVYCAPSTSSTAAPASSSTVASSSTTGA